MSSTPYGHCTVFNDYSIGLHVQMGIEKQRRGEGTSQGSGRRPDIMLRISEVGVPGAKVRPPDSSSYAVTPSAQMSAAGSTASVRLPASCARMISGDA